jgi:hypothetical protein
MNKATLLKVASLALAASILSSPAHAIFRAYLAIDGNDANPCTLGAPCRLLPAAMTAVDAGGEIWMLDSANYNTGPVAVTKSVSILAVPGVVGSVVATGGGGNNGLNIATPGVKVSLRNLVFIMLTAGNYGVAFTDGAELTVQDCEFANFGLMGGAIFASVPSGKVTLRDTTLRNSPVGLNLSNGVRAVLERVRVLNNLTGIYVSNSRLAITESVISGNSQVGIDVYSGSVAQSYATLSNSEVSNNATGVKVASYIPGDSSSMVVAGSRFSHNTSQAILLYQGTSSQTNITLDGNVFAHNTAAVSTTGTVGTPTVFSRINNTLRNNAGGMGDSFGSSALTAY